MLIGKSNFSVDIFLFLSKLLIQEGIFPERNHCVLSGEDLKEVMQFVLLDEQGGFADSSCVNMDMLDSRLSTLQATELWHLLCRVAQSKYTQINEFDNIPQIFSSRLIDYLFYQVNFEKREFKTISLLF